ncbi:MAG: prepilin-type N-terminal cleavage/methylation domain-containing protein [Planctomycetes bacterium]|nr:prepilin-type N-terminal cleavage/methylation domain-containing protein [Planctomycetota bacterium]
MRIRSPRRPRGFTLLEVLISIVILVLGAVAILPLFAVGAQSHKRATDQVHTSLIAPRIAAMIQENLTGTNPGDLKDAQFVEYGREYRYDAQFARLPGTAGDPLADAAFALRVTVKWRESGADHVETFETVVLRRFPPPVSGRAARR